MSFQDRTLTCLDCSQPFTFTADDQQYHREKGYTNEPKRCASCRQNRRSSSSSYNSSYGGSSSVRAASAKCTTPSVLSAGRTRKCPSARAETGRSTVATASASSPLQRPGAGNPQQRELNRGPEQGPLFLYPLVVRRYSVGMCGLPRVPLMGSGVRVPVQLGVGIGIGQVNMVMEMRGELH